MSLKVLSPESTVRSQACPACDRELMDGEKLVAGVCANCKSNFAAKYPVKTLVPVWTESDGQFGPAGEARPTKNGQAMLEPDEYGFLDLPAENGEAEQVREKLALLYNRMKRGLLAFKAYAGNKDLAWACLTRALGYHDLTDYATDRELAVRLGLPHPERSGKQTVNKCFQKFCRKMEISPMEGRRICQAREKMRAARVKQLGGKS